MDIELAQALKENAELEKENAELQDKLKNLASVAEVRLANWQKLEQENAELKVKLAELEKENADNESEARELNIRLDRLIKENAELKEKLGDVQMQKAGEKSDLVWKLKTANEQKADQLTKAKTYLKYFIEILKRLGANKEPLVVEAEQFLNSEVKK